MYIELLYGRNGLVVALPDTVDVIRPIHVPGLQNEEDAIRKALLDPINSLPLSNKVHSGDRVVIVHTDITRATPNRSILPILLKELEEAGVDRKNIILLNGLGTHRSQTDQELREMLGDSIFERYCCKQHNCYDDQNLVSIGITSAGNPVRINRDYLESDIRILTGFIEPHFFAGFSGGPKAVLPALAGIETVYSNHGYSMIANPKAKWGITSGNPIWEEIQEVALRTEPSFILNVTLNAMRQITGVFAGDMEAAHRIGCEFVRETSMAPVKEPYDVVITTNSGYPLDQNLYQSVKGMSAAKQIVREGGAILLAAACEDGLPNHGRYAELLQRAGTPSKVLEMVSQPGFCEQDQWQVQLQAQIQQHADVYVYSEGLSTDQITNALLTPSNGIESTLNELINKNGSNMRVCVLPEGPQTIPYLKKDHS